MSAADFQAPGSSPPTESGVFEFSARPAGRRQRYRLNLLLLVVTFFTCAVAGARIQQNFDRNLPVFDIERDLNSFSRWWSQPATLLDGLPFTLALMGILLAHELGHYLACRYYRVDATLPYFIPAPTFAGTFGAFIRIRAPIYSKRVLFDIGIAGPLAGFAVLLPVLSIGLAFSKVIPGIAYQGSLKFGTPALLWVLEKAIFNGTPGGDIYLHPVARAAWIGILATALNLLPIGQLDGGHVLYSLAGSKHKVLSRLFAASLVPLGFFWPAWWGWAAFLFFFALRHPPIYDAADLGRPRKLLGWLAIGIFLLCFSFAPVATINNL